MPSIYDWSVNASDNGNSDAAINWQEGQQRKTVNNSARAMMGRDAEFVKDISGALLAGGSANVLTVTANSAFTTYANGRVIVLRAASSNTAAATLSVNAIGAKPIKVFTSAGETALVGGEIQANGVYVFYYSASIASGSGGWVLVNPSPVVGEEFTASEIVYQVSSTTLSSATTIDITGLDTDFRQFEISGELGGVTSNPSTTHFLLSLGNGSTWTEMATANPLVQWANGGTTARRFFATVQNLDDAALSIFIRSMTANDGEYAQFILPATYATRPISALRFRLAPPSGTSTLSISRLSVRGIRA